MRRDIRRKENSNQKIHDMEFPKRLDGIIYVRQSTMVQKLKNIHSFEMQTEKFLEHFRNMGCTGNIEIIADDEAMSGTLDIHVRPGMTRMMKMIESDSIGWIAAVHVNRFTRDPWLITPAVLMKTCHNHDVWIATLRMHFNFKDEYCQRVFMLEAEESAKHLQWMRLVLGGGKSAASDKGYYDGRYLVPGYIVDRTDPQHKKYIIYEPHAEVVRWLYRRFFELDGNFPALRREVENMSYLFPKFETWVDVKNTTKLLLKETTEGNYKPSRPGLISILTNPVFIGWWIPFDGGYIENNHEPIISEALFTYAHKRLSAYDLQGERQRPERVTRNGLANALLKKVIESPDGWLYADSRREGETERVTYKCAHNNSDRLLNEHVFSITADFIDNAFLEKFYEHVCSLPQICEDWKDKPDEKQDTKNEDREKNIKKSIKEAELKMQRINELMTDIENPLPNSMKQDLIKQYTGLEKKKKELEEALKAEPEEDDQTIIFEIANLVPLIVEKWDTLPFEQKLRFIGAIVRKVILNQVAPAWIRIEIQWKIDEWSTDIGHIWRYPNMTRWTPEEEAVLQEKYSNGDAADILKALPDRAWSAIKLHAQKLGIVRSLERRHIGNSIPSVNKQYHSLSQLDKDYALQHGLDESRKNVQWSRLSFL